MERLHPILLLACTLLFLTLNLFPKGSQGFPNFPDSESEEDSGILSRVARQIPFLNWWNSGSGKGGEDRKFQSKSGGVDRPFYTGDKYQPSVVFSQNNRSNSNAVSAADRKSRFLSLFTVVRFDNTECLSASGDNGTCYPAAECHRRGGAQNGRCAKGYGVCCVFSKSCGASTNQNVTYFTHTGYPSTFDGTGSCQLTVYKCSPDVCQLRLDFDSFNIAQPGIQGVCNNDQFIVSGSTSAVPVTCGVNTGNHMYIDVGVDNSPITLSVVTSGPAYSRSWKIKVTQIKCRDLGRSPEGCLQYYRGVSGTIRSFNFDFNSGQQLSNQDYTSCVRVERNFCGIRYTACQENVQFGQNQAAVRPRSFSITGMTVTATGARVGANECQTDWVTIPCATTSGKTQQLSGLICQDRICGDTFNSEGGGAMLQVPVYSYVKPFRLHYHTDGNETTDSGNRGFCLNYIQQPCSTI